MNYSQEQIDEMVEVLWPIARQVMTFRRYQYLNRSEVRPLAEQVLREAEHILQKGN